MVTVHINVYTDSQFRVKYQILELNDPNIKSVIVLTKSPEIRIIATADNDVQIAATVKRIKKVFNVNKVLTQWVL